MCTWSAANDRTVRATCGQSVPAARTPSRSRPSAASVGGSCASSCAYGDRSVGARGSGSWVQAQIAAMTTARMRHGHALRAAVAWSGQAGLLGHFGSEVVLLLLEALAELEADEPADL